MRKWARSLTIAGGMGARAAAALAALCLGACLPAEKPLPPDEAMAYAAARIDRILATERRYSDAEVPALPHRTPENPARVEGWFFDHPLMNPIHGTGGPLEAFHTQHPGLEFVPRYIGDWPVAVQKLMVAVAAGDVPDVALVKRNWLSRLAESGRLAAIDTLWSPERIADVRRPFRESLTLDGRLYGLPADGFCSVLYYNPHEVPNPPQTWAELEGVAAQLGGSAVGHLPFVESLWSAGGALCDTGGTGFTASEGEKALRFLLHLRDAGWTQTAWMLRSDAAFDTFASGRVAMTAGTSAHMHRLADSPIPWAVAPIPGERGGVSRLSDDVIVVFGDYALAKCEAIAEVLDFLTGATLQGERAATRGSVPVRASVAAGSSVAPGLEAAFQRARNVPLIPAAAAIEFEVDRAVTRAFRYEPARD